MDFPKQLEQFRSDVDAAINALTPQASTRPGILHAAMRYSLEAGGKRLRPTLILAGHALFPNDHDPMPAAVAVECLHTYSLIHDDLPCMDNSDLRRGKPTCHKQFDEATALLAGDALLTLPFQILSQHYASDATLAVALIAELATAAGSEHLIGGQMEDLIGEQSAFTRERLEFIHLNKTAALIAASIVMGIRMGTSDTEALQHARAMGRDLGLAFQVIDDILDATADTETLGKTAGIDVQNNKLTYTSLYGLDTARQHARALTQSASQHCEKLGGDNAFLLALIEHLEHRVS